jgi:AraC-like DNA-binding protein
MAASAPTLDAATGRPADHLLPLVHAYRGYRYEGFAPGTHLGLPSHHLTVVISLGDPTRLAALPDPAQPPAAFPALAGGLHTRPAVIAHDGAQHGVQLELTPAGARSLLGLPAAALGQTVVDLRELLGPTAGELAERMAAAPAWGDRFAVLDEVLARRTARSAPPPAPPAALRRAWQRIVASGGTARVSDVAAEVGWSRRHLAERFAREYGLTPKDATRVVRFERSRRLLQRRDRPTLAAVAAACGYYDQAHLARDWRDLAGCPPSAWLAAEELPSVQDTAARRGGGSRT